MSWQWEASILSCTYTFATHFGFVTVHSADCCCEGPSASPFLPSLCDKLGNVGGKSSELLFLQHCVLWHFLACYWAVHGFLSVCNRPAVPEGAWTLCCVKPFSLTPMSQQSHCAPASHPWVKRRHQLITVEYADSPAANPARFINARELAFSCEIGGTGHPHPQLCWTTCFPHTMQGRLQQPGTGCSDKIQSCPVVQEHVQLQEVTCVDTSAKRLTDHIYVINFSVNRFLTGFRISSFRFCKLSS